MVAEVHAHFGDFRLDLAAQSIYEFVWNEYCDWYLEFTKSTLQGSDEAAQDATRADTRAATRHTLLSVLETALRCLHPIMPFISEEIWQRIRTPLGIEGASIMLQLTVPLYQAGAPEANIRRSKQIASQRRQDVVTERRTAVANAINAWQTLVTARAAIVAIETSVAANKIALEGVRLEEQVGARTIIDVLDAEQEYLASQVNLVSAHREEVVAAYTVLAAVVRGARPIAPSPDDTLEAGDELLIVAGADADRDALHHLLVAPPAAR